MAKKKHAGGRPSKFKPEYCQMLIEHMSQGYSYESFAAKVDDCRATLYNWEEKHPEFLDAKKRAVDKCLEKWETLCLDSIHDPGTLSVPLWIFNMKNRFKWQDKVDIETHSTQTLTVLTTDGKQNKFDV